LRWEAGNGGRGGGGAGRRRGPRAKEILERTQIQRWPCGGGGGEGEAIGLGVILPTSKKKHFGIDTILITLITTTIHLNETK